LKVPLAAGEGFAAAVAGYGLPGVPAPPAEPLGPEAWRDVQLTVKHQRIEGLLGAAVAAGAWAVTPSQLDDVRDAVRARANVDLCLEREHVDTVRTLENAGFSSRVLKGQAWAHSFYPDPGWRGFGDVDLLVRSDDWYQVIEVLQGRGARRIVPELRPGFDRRFGKEATLVTRNGWQIDLHRTLVVGPFGLWVDEGDLFARPGSVTIGGVTMATLNQEASFMHACYNAALADDPPRLIAVRDVCQVALAGHPDPSVVEEMARRWRAGAVISRALGLTSDLLGQELWRLPVAASFATRRGTAVERALMATYRGPGSGYTSQLATVAAVAGARERLAYLRALVRPDRAYLDARASTPLRYLRTAARRTWQRR
jgi:hypothetical protein